MDSGREEQDARERGKFLYSEEGRAKKVTRNRQNWAGIGGQGCTHGAYTGGCGQGGGKKKVGGGRMD